ncbi:UNVERIFIED_ORG: DNA-binding transcriptional LysR family regulator [Paraburkholderia sediminicola]|nr:DNA-binding transcriptional LysR family regulator [Paraburkholderia sediminicola]
MNHLQSMRVFTKVAEVGSFVRTAHAMGISPPVVTRHVADLEEYLGTRLLTRTTRFQSLTESGRVYLERITAILSDLEELEQMVVARTHEPVGTLRIVAPVVFGLRTLGPLLQSYTERYPNVVPEITLLDRPLDLVEEGFDVGVLSARQMGISSLVIRHLTTVHMTACATPGYLQKHGAPTRPEQLQDHPSLSLPSEYGGDEWVFTALDGKSEVRMRPTKAIVANNTEMLRQFALLGMGFAILPSYLIGNDLARGRLVRLLRGYRLPQIEVQMAYPSRHHLPAKVRTFVDHLVEHFDQTSCNPVELSMNLQGAAQTMRVAANNGPVLAV